MTLSAEPTGVRVLPSQARDLLPAAPASGPVWGVGSGLFLISTHPARPGCSRGGCCANPTYCTVPTGSGTACQTSRGLTVCPAVPHCQQGHGHPLQPMAVNIGCHRSATSVNGCCGSALACQSQASSLNSHAPVTAGAISEGERRGRCSE